MKPTGEREALDVSELVERLHDLHKQATEERSHYYTGKCIRDSIVAITELRKLAARYLWLRDEIGITMHLGGGKLGNKVHPSQLDRVIDEQIAEARSG